MPYKCVIWKEGILLYEIVKSLMQWDCMVHNIYKQYTYLALVKPLSMNIIFGVNKYKYS